MGAEPERRPGEGTHRKTVAPMAAASRDLLSLGVHTPAQPLLLALPRLVLPISAATRNVGVTEAGGCKPLHFALRRA